MQEQEEEPSPQHTVGQHLALHYTLMLAYARAGVTPVDPQPGVPESFETDSTDYVQAPLDTLMKFHSRLKACAAQIPHSSTSLTWLQTRDEEERQQWVEVHRSTNLALGKIVKQVYQQREAMWIVPKFTETLRPPSGAASSQRDLQRARQQRPKPPLAAHGQTPASSAQRGTTKTASALKNGKE
eukprot:5972926-Amphidinium_carterae.1